MNTATAKSSARPVSPRRLEANRRNAQLSTGPATPEGKAAVRLNACRHHLTGQVAILPDEERHALEAFCAPIVQELNPASAIEGQLARAVAEDMWRLSRARAIENNWFARAIAYGAAEPMAADHPQILAAVHMARAFAEDAQSFQRLTLYEQRIQRNLAKNRAALAEARQPRLAAEEKAAEEARLMRLACKQKGLPFDPAAEAKVNGGFVFSTAQIDATTERNALLNEVRRAEIASRIAPFVKSASARRPFLVNNAPWAS